MRVSDCARFEFLDLDQIGSYWTKVQYTGTDGSCTVAQNLPLLSNALISSWLPKNETDLQQALMKRSDRTLRLKLKRG